MTEKTEDYSPALRAKMNSFQFLVTTPDGKEKILANWEPLETKEEDPEET